MTAAPPAHARAGGLRTRTWSRLSRVPRELAALLAVAAVLAVTWAIALVPLQGLDENIHVSYAQQLAETGQGPFFDRGTFTISTELGIALETLNLRGVQGNPGARPARTELEERMWRERAAGVTEAQRKDGTGPSPLARNPQLYYAYQAVPYLVLQDADLFDRLIAMRLANALLFVVTVLLTWLLATELFGRRARLQVTLATAVVALWPMMTFMAGTVNPDTALATAYTGVLLLAVRLLNRGFSFGRVIGLFVAAAACLLVHGRGVPALGIVAVTLVVTFLRHRGPGRRVAAMAGAGALAGLAPILLSKVILTPGSGGGLYGSEVNIPTETFSLKGFASQTWQFYFEKLSFMSPRLGPDFGYRQVVVERFLGGAFGVLEITYPTWVYDLLQVGVVLAVIAVWTAAVVHRDRVRRAWPVLLIVAAMALGLLLLLHLASYRALLSGPDPLVTGRYLLPLAPLIALALAWFVGVLPRAARGLAAGGLLTTVLLLQLGALGMTVVRFHV